MSAFSPAVHVRALRLESEHLRRYIAALRPDDWTHDTACERWQVRDVVAHLAGAAQAFAERIARGLNGDTSPSKGLPRAGSVNATSWSETNARRWIDIRKEVGGRLSETFSEACDQFNDFVEGLKPEDWEVPCYHPGGIVPVRTLIGFRILELAVHGWDIRSKLEPPAQLSNEALPVIIEFFSRYLEWFFQPGSRLPKPVCFRFDMEGATPDRVDIVVEGHRAYMQTASEIEADVTYLCGPETFVLLMCGRTTLESETAQGQVVTQGNGNTALDFSQWFKGA